MLAALALAVTSCGGSDDGKDTSTPVAGTSTPGQTQPSPTETQQEPADRANSDAQNGNGGSSASDAERAAGSDQTSGSKPATAPSKGGASGDQQQKSGKPRTPDEQIAAMSPAKRRALHKDLYEQGLKLCYAYGPKELAKSYNLTGGDPETIASQYARAYEAATPTLILPYQQGCLAGFRKFARNPPKN
jgi:hypothetical protein